MFKRTGVNLWTWTDICSMSTTEDSKKPELGPQKRIFPPLYKSSGDPASDRLAFFHVLERLKVCSITICSQLGNLTTVSFVLCPVAYRISDTEANGMGR